VSAETLAALRRGELAGARQLDLSRCGLTALPDEVLALADTLDVLDLAGNALTALPAWFSRLHRLTAVFGSGNPFTTLPPVLGDCPALSQVGFRGCGLQQVPGEALPPQLRWLTLTDNALAELPATLGQRPLLAKLMLSGNRLQALPATLAGAPALELLRVAANRFDALPGWVAELPALAWLAAAGNPFDTAPHPPAVPDIPWAALQLGALLGEGASGRIQAATWQTEPGRPPRDVAVKRFKGAMTSDGLPEREMAACLAAGAHPQLMSALGRVQGAPDGEQALVMPLLPAHWQPLAGPPSLASCSRDVYQPALRLAPATLRRLAGGVGAAVAHLHAQGLLHGDLYAHNILWDGAQGAAVLSDFGAAVFVPPGVSAPAWQRLEVRAWGLLLGELLARCEAPQPSLQALAAACTQPQPAARPLLREALAAL
jgi:hypothetical protein